MSKLNIFHFTTDLEIMISDYLWIKDFSQDICNIYNLNHLTLFRKIRIYYSVYWINISINRCKGWKCSSHVPENVQAFRKHKIKVNVHSKRHPIFTKIFSSIWPEGFLLRVYVIKPPNHPCAPRCIYNIKQFFFMGTLLPVEMHNFNDMTQKVFPVKYFYLQCPVKLTNYCLK